MGVPGSTHDYTSVEFLPRPEDQLSGPRRGELVDVLAQNEVNLPCTHLGFHVFAELDRVGIVEKPIVTLDDGDFLVLWREVSIASPNSDESKGTLTGYSSRSSPASSTKGPSSGRKKCGDCEPCTYRFQQRHLQRSQRPLRT